MGALYNAMSERVEAPFFGNASKSIHEHVYVRVTATVLIPSLGPRSLRNFVALAREQNLLQFIGATS